MTQEIWTRLISALPVGMKVDQVARLFRRSPALTLRRLRQNGYPLPKRREWEPPTWAERVDWSNSNVAISRHTGLSRERIRQMRLALRKPKVESRGRKPNKRHARKN